MSNTTHIVIGAGTPESDLLLETVKDTIANKRKLSNTIFSGNPSYRVSDVGLNSIDFSKMNIENCSFVNIYLSRCNFDRSVLNNCTFENCHIIECSFYNADLTGVIFKKVEHPYLYMPPLEFNYQRYYSNFLYSKLEGGLVKKLTIHDDVVFYITQSGEKFIKRCEQDASVQDWLEYSKSKSIDAGYARETLSKANSI